jgi:glycosyltransferase involved in cell wall biosynthesis
MELLDSLVDNRRVTWVGQIPPSAVPDHLAACDILASPHVPLVGGAEFFGSPTKLFEYIASGKAIVASALGQIGEVLQDGETALLVPPDNVPALTAALLRLADDPDLRERLGRRAQSQAKTQHSWAANAQRLLDAYRSLVR